MNYEQTIDYLYNTLPMFSRMGSAAFKKDLTNTRILCQHLGNPQQQFKSIHVGGTNGKGSTSHMLAAILQTAGYKTGLYTSPHLYDFRERIKIDGQLADESFVVDFVERIKPLMEEIQPSFFEITVAMAFQYFAQQQVDIAVIEVGLGGKLDSTNIIHPLLSVITNVGWDHMNMLGDNLQDIAREKAGIIKPATPVVVGEKNHATEEVFIKTAEEKGAPVFFASDRFSVPAFKPGNRVLEVDIHDKQYVLSGSYISELSGIYQLKNLCTVLQAVSLLQKDLTIHNDDIATGLEKTKTLTGLHGRWEIMQEQPKVVLEVAHNEPGIEEMLAQLALENFHSLHIVIGMVKDKDISKVLHLLPSGATYYFTQAHIPRALPAEELLKAAKAHQLKGQVYADVDKALKEAMAKADPADLILVCGSIFLVAEVDRKLFNN